MVILRLLVVLQVCWARDPYAVLGLARTATQREIKQAYLKAALKWHPDKNPTKEAEANFIEISEAYSTLAGTPPPTSRRKASKKHVEGRLAEAVLLFAQSFGIAKDGKIDWATLEGRVSELMTQAAESVEKSLRQRYLDEKGAVKWRQVAGDAAVAGAAVLMAYFGRDGDNQEL
mmetsp:Transcript_56858/g.132961  ORF Transcript_56858/g.132961 Transcript_56858/m.132961 type:complete len:174 (+) Transcript_56858:45-566(+)